MVGSPFGVFASELPKKLRGQIVRIELPGDGRQLSLAEVQVFKNGKNVALKKPATQISTGYGGAASRAVDGNTDPDYHKGSVTHTQPGSSNPWWEVDLGRAVNIEEIVLINRMTLQSRLDGFSLKVLDANRRVVFSREHCIPSATITFLQPGVKSSRRH